MRQFRLLATAAAIAAVSVTSAAAQGKSGSAPKGGTVKVSTTAKTSAPGNGAAKKSTTTASTTTTPTVPVPNPVSTKISKSPGQLARVKTMLPEGMTLEQATAGFRNQGQFIAALNASKNQGVSFVDLQTAMTTDGLSLGQAVKQVKAAPPATTPTTTTGTTTGTTTTGTAP